MRFSGAFDSHRRWRGDRPRGPRLLIRRTAPAGALLWTFPSGKLDPGESVAETAAREAREEAGVLVAPLIVLSSRVHPATGWRVVYVACRLLDGVAHAASPREVAWVRPAELGGFVPGGVYLPVQTWLEARAS
ncbi:NUDIX hydrolase [Streptomyces canus]|uniref:NUDIX hydrolase n=1 Tax=Streptomyces canus TaxID=58343 RepID=UPI0032524580